MKTVGAPTKYTTVTCPKCGHQVGLTYFTRHLSRCKGK